MLYVFSKTDEKQNLVANGLNLFSQTLISKMAESKNYYSRLRLTIYDIICVFTSIINT